MCCNNNNSKVQFNSATGNGYIFFKTRSDYICNYSCGFRMDTTHSNDDIDYSIVFQYQNYYFIEISMNGTEMLTYSKNLVAFELKEKYAEYICTQISPIFTVYQEDENGEAVSSSVIYSYALQDAGLYFIGGTIVPTAQYRIIPDTKNLLDSNISDEGKVENQDNIMLLVYRLSTNPPENPQILDL